MGKIRIPISGSVGKSVLVDADLGARVAALETAIAALTKGSVSRHANLQGLQVGNDHPQYPIKAGAEVIAGSWNFSTPPDIIGGTLIEYIQDTMGATFINSARISFTYSDAGNTETADIIADSVTNTYLANMAAATLKGRAVGAGTGDPTDLTAAQARAIIVTDGQALTKVDDTNVTLTLSGAPTTALLTATSLTLGWTGQLGVARGGTGLASYTVGDILYASGTTALSKLGVGSNGQVLTLASGVPSWATPAAGGSFSGARVTRTTTQAISGTTVVQFDVESYDQGSYHDNVTNNTRVTAPAAGYYGIKAGVEFSAAGDTTAALRVNGSTIIASTALTVTAHQRYTLACSVSLTAADYVELVVTNSGSGNVDVTVMPPFIAMELLANTSGGGGGGGDLVKIASITLGSPAATATFSSIPSSYTSLMLTFSVNSATQFDVMYMQFNGDTGANYDTAQDFGGSGNGGAVTLSNAKPEIGSAPGSAFSASQRLAGRIFIPYYSDTSGYKESAIHTGRRDASALYSEEYIHNWHNTAAITQIVLGFVSGNNFVAGSRFDLYGMT